MVLCKFFQQGSCRFGSKCANEHLDIKQVIKTDVESAINGKQWPLSTYGPFKEKPSIPNFIDDQSFEEVRMLCYEARQKNFFDQFHQQFNKEALEASNKMKALLQMPPEVVDLAIGLYDSTSDAKVSNSVSNPFGFTSSAASGAGSLFSKFTAPTNNIFSNNNSTFTATNQGGSGLLENPSAFAPQQQQQTSIFAQPPKSANSIFVSGGNTNTQQNTSIFSQQPVQSNIFASSTPQQQPTLTGTGLFSQQNQFMHQPQQNSNIFRQGAQASQPQQGLFAQTAQTMQQQQQTQQQQGLFAQAAQQTPAGQGLFAQASQQAQTIFSQAVQQQQQQQQQQQTNSTMFQQNLTNSGPQQQQTNLNIFQQNQPIATQQQQPPSGFFQQAALQTQNAAEEMHHLTQVNSTLYSRLEDLTAEEIEAFKSDYFIPGKIPFNPPPRELIN